MSKRLRKKKKVRIPYKFSIDENGMAVGNLRAVPEASNIRITDLLRAYASIIEQQKSYLPERLIMTEETFHYWQNLLGFENEKDKETEEREENDSQEGPWFT